ncbi:MAG: hypothetical protein ACWA5L_06925 [bacterium]
MPLFSSYLTFLQWQSRQLHLLDRCLQQELRLLFAQSLVPKRPAKADWPERQIWRRARKLRYWQKIQQRRAAVQAHIAQLQTAKAQAQQRLIMARRAQRRHRQQHAPFLAEHPLKASGPPSIPAQKGRSRPLGQYTFDYGPAPP